MKPTRKTRSTNSGFCADALSWPARVLSEGSDCLRRFIRKLANFASWLVGQSYALTIFGTDIGVDPLAIEDLQMALLSQHGITSSRYSINHSVKSAHDLLATMSGMDYVVTCRFHGVVFAHLLNKPVLAIAHHPKVIDLMTDLGLSNYCVDIRDFDLKLLAEKFARWSLMRRK